MSWTVAAQQLGGAALGIGLNALGDKRQVKQQQRLTDIQEAAQRRLNQHGAELAYDMWNKTNYGAQVEHMKKAGINPALLYGMGGAGGATTDTGTGGAAIGGHSATGPDYAGMGMDIAATAANIKLQEAQAKKLEAETESIQGVETEEAYTRIANLVQNTKNQRAQQLGQEIQNRISELDEHYLRGSLQDRLKGVEFTTKKIMNEWRKLEDEVYISNATKQEIIESIRQKVIESYLTNANLAKDLNVKEEAIKKSGAERQRIAAEVKKWAGELEIAFKQLTINHHEMLQGWENVNTNKKQAAIAEFKAILEQQFPNLWNVAGKWGNEMLDGLIQIMKDLGFEATDFNKRVEDNRNKIDK